jgi:phasin family protein
MQAPMMHRNKSPVAPIGGANHMNAQVEKYFTPVQELNTLAIENLEKLVNLQVKRFEETARISVEQMKAATAIKDAEGLKDFLGNYTETVRKLSENTVEDARTIIEMGTTYSNEAKRIFKDSLKAN